MATEEEKVKETEEKVEEPSEELETLAEEETIKKVSELLNEKEEPTEEKIKEVEKTEESSEEVETLVPIIDEEFVKLHPATKRYFGKPVTELGKQYQSIVTEFNEKSRLIIELKKKLAAATIPKIEDEPDPVDEKEAHAKWTIEREEAIRADERSKTTEQPQQVNYQTEIAKRLPADVDVNKVIESWSNANAMRLYDNYGELRPESRLLYENNPDILTQEVIEYYDLSSKADKTDEEIKKAGHTRVRDDFKKARGKSVRKTDVNIVERTKEATETDRMLENIIKMEQEE